MSGLVFGVTLVAQHPLIGCKLGRWTIVVGCLPFGICPAPVLLWRTRSSDQGVVASDVLPAFGRELVPLVEAKHFHKTRGMRPVAGEAHHLIRRTRAVQDRIIVFRMGLECQKVAGILCKRHKR